VVRQQCFNPDLQLSAVLTPLEDLRAKGCTLEDGKTGQARCDQLRQELSRLTVVCSTHAPTLLADAVVSYDEHQAVRAQQLLDEILMLTGPHPDAAALRARIAIEEGNLPFARRLLEQQLRVSPDSAALHETFGAALYLNKQLPEAQKELTTAGALGAPTWRIAYHLGLVAEAAGRLDEARQRYTESVGSNPGSTLAQSRLNALKARNP
jgi:Tfp pilus assembly protein PilF